MMEAKEWEMWVKLGDGSSSAVSLANTATVDALRKAIKAVFAPKLDGYAASDLVVRAPAAPVTDPMTVDPTTWVKLDNPKAKLADVLKPTIEAADKGEYEVCVELPATKEEEEPPTKKAKKDVAKVTIVRGQRVPIGDLFPLHAGSPEAQSIFVTDSMADIIEIFDERVAAKQSVWFAGTPGTGKSQLGRLWATRCAQNGNSVLYGETRNLGYWLTRVDSEGWSQSEVDRKEFCRILAAASNDPNRIVILDGAAQASKNMPQLAATLMENKKIVISSGQLVLKQVGLPHVQLPAWTLADVLSASEDPTFYGQTVLCKEAKTFEDRKEFITAKFGVTGGSPLLIFETLTKEAKNMLIAAMALLSPEEKKQVLFGGLAPSHDRRSQNALIHYFVNPNIVDAAERYEQLIRKFSSQFVLRQLQAALDLADVQALYAQCQAINRVMEGWAFEELMLRKLSEQPGQTS